MSDYQQAIDILAFIQRHPGHASQKPHGRRYGASGEPLAAGHKKKDVVTGGSKAAQGRQKAQKQTGKRTKQAKPKAGGGSGQEASAKPTADTANSEYPRLQKLLKGGLKVRDEDSDFTQEQMQDLGKVPDKLLMKMADNGVTLHVGDRNLAELDSMQSLANDQPRGWPPGKTWKDVGGAYNPACQCAVVGGKGKSGSVSTILHEYGHALHSNGGLSASQQSRLAAIHQKIYKKLPNYLQQGGPGGQAGVSEMWAEGFAHALKAPDSAKGFYSQDLVDLVNEVVK